ncbi:MAG: hypothetical protein KatS3mg011_1514 [Acidimicrobiia bacterium]|nr:MAG: hypothetical protein KatS3mg011_1514 [Acidimicrobiia bacterium]
MNPDPRPGRWLLPLVILGMVVFTYAFVRSLPGAEAGTSDTTVTTVGSPPTGGDSDTTTTTTTTAPPAVSPELQAYLEQVNALETRLVELQTELATINANWENRESTGVTYSETEAALVDLVARVEQWAGEVEAVTPPEALVVAHDTVVQFAQTIATTAQEVLAGLRAPDTGEQRREAVSRFDDAVRGFTAAVDQARQAAQAAG